MKCKVTLASTVLLLATNSWADQLPYYTLEEISVTGEGANYGPYPSALSDDGEFIGTYSLKAAISNNIDIGLPFTFNRDCQTDFINCEFDFYGSETAGQLSFENAYQAWRNAQAQAADGYSSYFMSNTLFNGASQAQIPYALDDQSTDNSVDVNVTDVNDQRVVVGYSSAPYSNGEREFVRRAFIKPNLGERISLLPDFDTNGGFTSAYKIKEVTYGDESKKTLVVGAASVSYPRDEDEYFNNCYFSLQDDQIGTLNELVECPGFDTQAWAWDVTDSLANITQLSVTGSALASEWLDDNQDNADSYITYSASALDINASGVAVGMSTFKRTNNSEGGRGRAIFMTPSKEGVYGKPTEITQVYNDISEQKDSLYNTWAQAITDSSLVVGNREYAVSKGVNLPVEFFVFDIKDTTITFPLLDKKVLTTQQALEGQSSGKRGANSYVYDINNAGFVVGEADDHDQVSPVQNGVPRSQSAFLYDNNREKSWFINDLLCTEENSVVTSPRVRISSARVINDDGVVLAAGYKYSSDNDYINKVNATQVAFKLTPRDDMMPDNSPNCWQSELFKEIDQPFQRTGAAGLWLWIFSAPLLFIRRFYRSHAPRGNA